MGTYVALALALISASPAAIAPDLCAPVLAAARQGGDPAAPATRALVVLKAPLPRMLAALQDRFGPAPRLSSAVTELAGGAPDVEVSLYHLAGSDLYEAESIQGSMACSTSVFFRASPGRRLELLDTPLGQSEQGLCWDDVGRLAAIDGRAAFVETSPGAVEFSRRVGVTPWTGGGWGPACYVQATYAYAAPKLADTFVAPGFDATGLDALALAIATQRETAPDAKTFAYGAAPETPAVKRMRTLASAKDFPTAVPSFGAPVRQAFSDFSPDDAVLFPLAIGSKTYLARLGGGWVGWRSSDILLLAIYRLKGHALDPVAGFVIDQTRGPLRTAARIPPPKRDP